MNNKPPRVGLATASETITDRARRAYEGFAEVVDPRGATSRLTCVVDHGMFVRHGKLGRVGRGSLRSAGTGTRAGTGYVERQSRRDTLLLLPAEDAAGHTLVERELRTLLALQLIMDGWIPLHAGAVATRSGEVILLMGPKMAGKTTALLQLLQTGSYGLLSNDKTFVRAEAGQLVVRALPVAAPIRGTVLHRFPPLGRLWRHRAELHVDNPETDVDTSAARLLVPVRLLARAFGAPVVSTGIVRAVIRLRHDPQRASSRARTLDRNGLGRLFDSERLDFDPRWNRVWLGDEPAFVDSEAAASNRTAFMSCAGYWFTSAPRDDDALLRFASSLPVETPDRAT